MFEPELPNENGLQQAPTVEAEKPETLPKKTMHGAKAEKGETLLRFSEFYVAEEQFPERRRRWVFVVSNVRGSYE